MIDYLIFCVMYIYGNTYEYSFLVFSNEYTHFHALHFYQNVSQKMERFYRKIRGSGSNLEKGKISGDLATNWHDRVTEN